MPAKRYAISASQNASGGPNSVPNWNSWPIASTSGSWPGGTPYPGKLRRGRLQRQIGIHGHFDHGLAVECRDRCERAAVMDGGTEPVQRVEVLRHAVAHMALEAVARVCKAHPHHQAVTGDLGDDRSSRNR